jgi:hypothetical protein
MDSGNKSCWPEAMCERRKHSQEELAGPLVAEQPAVEAPADKVPAFLVTGTDRSTKGKSAEAALHAEDSAERTAEDVDADSGIGRRGWRRLTRPAMLEADDLAEDADMDSGVGRRGRRRPTKTAMTESTERAEE